MTVYQSIPSAGVLEAFAPGFTHTSVTRRFGVMQRALGAWIEAERDLEHSGSWDPACDHWLRDAEAARAAVRAARASHKAASSSSVVPRKRVWYWL